MPCDIIRRERERERERETYREAVRENVNALKILVIKLRERERDREALSWERKRVALIHQKHRPVYQGGWVCVPCAPATRSFLSFCFPAKPNRGELRGFILPSILSLFFVYFFYLFFKEIFFGVWHTINK
jgi:hypothetical protein